MTKQAIVISRITNASRDKVLAFAAWQKAEERMEEAVKKAREEGCTENQINQAIQAAASGNDRVRLAMEKYIKTIEKAKEQISERA